MAAPTANYARACTNFNVNLDGTFTAFDGVTLVNNANVFLSIQINRSCRIIDAVQVTNVDAGAAVNNVVAVTDSTLASPVVSNTIFTISANQATASIVRPTSCTSVANALVTAGRYIRYTAGNSTARHLCTLSLIGSSIP